MAVVQTRWAMSATKILVGAFAIVLAVAPAAAAVCGNGTVETGEDCDDGSSNGTANSCCTASCTFSGKSPDVIVGDLVGTANFGTVGGITAYGVGTTSCNLGSCWLNWISGTAEHPVIGQNMFRLKDGRFEQIGQAWLKHGFTALQNNNVCASDCTAAPNGTHLGVHCADPYDSSLNGSQTRLGPKDDVNANTGVYLFPDSRESTTGNAIFKRLQVHNTDVDPAQNSGALYFVEGQYVSHDDASSKNNPNNASYRSVTVGASPFNLTLTGSTVRTKAGIQAWKAADPTVTETTVSAPEGLFIVSAKATSLGGGVYHYEYAVQNLNDQRAGQSFTVPLPAGAVVTNVGFHDVDYHSGTPYDGTDWTPTVTASSVSWATSTYDVNINANALRWGTLYNFRFDANQAPGTSSVVLGLFRPGTPTSVSVTTVTPGVCGGAPNGTACNDGNACSPVDACQSGVCTAGSFVVCTASDQCHDPGTCAPATGACSNPAKVNGSPCNDGNACSVADSCQSGVCSAGSPVVCTASDLCHQAGTCAPATGTCSNPVAPDGTPCTDGNACTQSDACTAGLCTPGTPVVCTASDQCHDAGTCDAGTGGCSNPVRVDGSACDDGNVCTASDACTSGVCAGVGVQGPGEVGPNVQVSLDSGVATVSWTPVVGSTWSSLLRGLVSALPVGPGGGDEVCLESDIAGTSATDPENPPDGEAYWYLVQGANSCGSGTYGYQEQGGVSTTARVSATCP